MLTAIASPSASAPPPRQHPSSPPRRSAILFQDPVDVLCLLLGIKPKDLACPGRILKVDAKENNSARIEAAARDCFARVQSLRHRVPPEHGEWMMQVVSHARSSMLRATVAPAKPRPVQPALAPAALVAPGPSLEAPRVSEETPAIRTRGIDDQRDVLAGTSIRSMVPLVVCGLVLIGAGWFVDHWFKTWNQDTRRHAANARVLVESRPVPPVVTIGGDTPALTQKSPPASGRVEGSIPQAVHRTAADAQLELRDALTLSRRGSFDEALRLTRRASRLLPEQAAGLSLLVKYARQYSGLAEEARKSLNGSCEIDLGAPYDKAQFVEQNADQIVLFANGKHQTFSIQQFNVLAGVRFRVTRDFLDNAVNPANDLILGACHFLMKLDGRGEQAAGSDFVREAERRINKAIASGKPAYVEPGTMMLQAIKALADE